MRGRFGAPTAPRAKPMLDSRRRIVIRFINLYYPLFAIVILLWVSSSAGAKCGDFEIESFVGSTFEWDAQMPSSAKKRGRRLAASVLVLRLVGVNSYSGESVTAAVTLGLYRTTADWSVKKNRMPVWFGVTGFPLTVYATLLDPVTAYTKL